MQHTKLYLTSERTWNATMIDENEKQEDLPLELEIETEEETPQEETSDVVETKTEEEKDSDYGKRVQKRIKNLVEQKRDADKKADEKDQIVKNLQARLARLEHGASSAAQEQFSNYYSSVKSQMQKAIEEGDTAKQVEYSEQLADMKATMKVQELQQQQQRVQRTQSPTVGRAAQPEAPAKAMNWWQRNQWFNASGFERETAAARAIDVQLDLEGFDKDGEEYYTTLNNRLRKMFPELISSEDSSNTRARPQSRSRQPITPTAGGKSQVVGNRVQMTKDELRMARELGLTGKDQLNAYAKELRTRKKET